MIYHKEEILNIKVTLMKIHSVFKILLIASLTLILTSLDVFAKNSTVTGNGYSVLIKSDSGCASGFLTSNNQIITANHVVSSCIKGVCKGFDIFLDGKRLIIEELSVEKVSFPFDVAVLKVVGSNIPTTGIDLSNTTIGNIGTKVTIEGFPKCGELKESKGEILDSTSLVGATTAKTNYGNSGSIILDDQKRFVGMATKAFSLSGAIKSLITGAEHEGYFIKAQHINKIIELSQEETLPYEIKVLKNSYMKDIMQNTSQKKHEMTFHFVLMTNKIFENLSLQKIGENSFLREILDSYQSAPFILQNISYSRPLNDIEEDAEILSLAYSFEKNGFRSSKLNLLNSIKFKEDLNTKERSLNHKKELNLIIDNAQKNIQFSYIMTYIARGLWFILIGIFILYIWIFGTGYCYKVFQGNFIKRTFLALFWPISAIANKFFKKEKRKK